MTRVLRIEPQAGTPPGPVASLSLSGGEASGLLALAELGRIYLDVDPRAISAPGRRANALRALRRLRDFSASL